jgi:hypothetical protein
MIKPFGNTCYTPTNDRVDRFGYLSRCRSR